MMKVSLFHKHQKVSLMNTNVVVDLGETRAGRNLEHHAESYKELMGVSQPQSDYDAISQIFFHFQYFTEIKELIKFPLKRPAYVQET